MQKNVTLRFRVEDRHEQRLRELGEQTGLNMSQVFRLLIENARLEPRPQLVTVIKLPADPQGGIAPTP